MKLIVTFTGPKDSIEAQLHEIETNLIDHYQVKREIKQVFDNSKETGWNDPSVYN